MKKVTRFFLMTAIALGLVACNKDEAPKSGNNGDGDVWASFTIALPANSGLRLKPVMLMTLRPKIPMWVPKTSRK